MSVDGVSIFSKLALGYFPHIALVSSRVAEFIKDKDEGKDLHKYTSGSYSPVKEHQSYHHPRSPQKKTNPNSPYIKGNSEHVKSPKASNAHKGDASPKNSPNNSSSNWQTNPKTKESKHEKKASEEVKHEQKT